MNKVRLGYSEMTAFLIMMIGMKVLLGYPRMVTQEGATAGWLLPVVSGLLAILLWLIIVRLLKRFPGKDLTEITELVLGPVFGMIVNSLVFLYFLLSTAFLLRISSDSVNLTLLSETPISAIAVIFLLTAGIAVYYGIEAITRSTSVALPYIFLGLIVVLVALYPFYDYKMLLPVMGRGLPSLLQYGFLGISAFGEVIVLAYLLSFFTVDYTKIKRVGVAAIGVTMLFFAVFTVVYLMVLHYPTSTETLVPVYQLSRSIFLGHYLQRVEAVFIIFAVFSAFLRVSAGLLVTLIILKDTLKIPLYYPLLGIISLLIFAVGFTPADLLETVQLESFLSMSFGWSITFALPIIIYLLALITGKGETRRK